MERVTRIVLVGAMLLAGSPAIAQQTTGSVVGRVADEQGGAVPGAVATALNRDTGFSRVGISDAQGLFRLNALPVGVYSVRIEPQGFTAVERDELVVNVAHVTDLDVTVRIAALSETVTVSGNAGIISTSQSSLGQIVDMRSARGLPLNGRQFANLAATVPGVGLGFNSDTTKSSQYTPQVSGGNGRNVSYLIDGGDNNDDTTGGLLQLYPLESIQEFNVLTHRFNAEYGRSNGAVLNVATRSGTNDIRGSWFTLFRDDALNGTTFSEKQAKVAKQAYRRYQYGGSIGGPIVRNRVHYFGAFERTQQDTKQVVNTLGLFPNADGVYDLPLRETMFSGKLTATVTPAQYLALRIARNDNSQPSNAGVRNAPESWSTSSNTYNSLNVNHTWVLGQSSLNEVVVQYADFDNSIPGNGQGQPSLVFPSGVRAGANPIAPQTTKQQKWQFRDDVSWSVTGRLGLGHEMKAGVSWIHEPTLEITTESLFDGQYTFAGDSLSAPIREILVIDGAATANLPMEQVALYMQDDWRVTNRLTLNLGVRWDFTDNLLDQSRNPNFLALQAAGLTGRFAGTALEDFGQKPRGDYDNVQPRLGAAYDLRGDGHDVIRGGWGIYTDLAYTNANALQAAFDALGGAGPVFIAADPTGLRKPDGSFFRVTDPLSSIASLNLVDPTIPTLSGQVVSPRLEQPYTRQASIGWARDLGAQTALTVDYVRVSGFHLNTRLRPNALVNGRRVFADLRLQPNSFQFRTAISKGQSQYDALILALRRRLSRGLDLNAWYTLSRSTSNVGPAVDELDANLVQDVSDPFGDVQDGPNTRTDARHRFTFSAIIEAPLGFQVAPFFMYRSGLPTHSVEGIDLNRDGNVVDRTTAAYRYTGLDDSGRATFEKMGTCETVNCSRRAPFSQLNLRVSRGFRLGGGTHLDAIVEVFNLFNAVNPFINVTTTRLSSAGAPLAGFMQPVAYAGDAGQPEQRVGQIGFRLTF